MTAHYLMIEAKHRWTRGLHASLADFTVTPGDEANADIVRDQSNVSLYCLDDATKRAVFVELPPDVDLAAAPFV